MVRSTSSSTLAAAREEFRVLLANPDSTERQWQDLFARRPDILARGLPLRLEPGQIHALGRPGRSEPDSSYSRAGETLSRSASLS